MPFDGSQFTTETVDHSQPLPRVSRSWQVVGGEWVFASLHHEDAAELAAATEAAAKVRNREDLADFGRAQEIAASEGVRQYRDLKARGLV